MIKLKKLTEKQQVLRHAIKKEHNFKVLFQITFWVETLKRHLENQNLKGKLKCPGH